nr:hypothetical protein Q903MT_gene4967 [Picea sitchensis]
MSVAMGMIVTDWGYRQVPPRLSATTVTALLSMISYQL